MLIKIKTKGRMLCQTDTVLMANKKDVTSTMPNAKSKKKERAQDELTTFMNMVMRMRQQQVISRDVFDSLMDVTDADMGWGMLEDYTTDKIENQPKVSVPEPVLKLDHNLELVEVPAPAGELAQDAEGGTTPDLAPNPDPEPDPGPEPDLVPEQSDVDKYVWTGWATIKNSVDAETKTESVHAAEYTVMDESSDENETPSENWTLSGRATDDKSMKGCLFATCIRCTSMIMIRFENGTIPSMAIAFTNKGSNGIVMTVCNSCDIKPKNWSEFCDGPLTSYVSEFNSLNLDPTLMRGSDVMRAAEIIVGSNVPMMKRKNSLLYMPRDKIMVKTSLLDVMSSVEVSKVATGNKSEILLPHLCGGFI